MSSGRAKATAPAKHSLNIHGGFFENAKSRTRWCKRLLERLEAEQAAINAQLADGTLYASDNSKALQLAQRNAAIDAELLEALERWELLGA